MRTYRIPPFVDASCRREPDFESPYPSISALCHKEKFAPRLRETDRVVYITHKGKYPPYEGHHWRLVAILEVIERFESHGDAARWYMTQGVPLPSNCMVEGNLPVPLDRTDRYVKSLEVWDRDYRVRARRCGVFLVCRPMFLDLHNPPAIVVEQMQAIFGRVLGTRNPPMISQQEFEALLSFARKRETTRPVPTPMETGSTRF